MAFSVKFLKRSARRCACILPFSFRKTPGVRPQSFWPRPLHDACLMRKKVVTPLLLPAASRAVLSLLFASLQQRSFRAPVPFVQTCDSQAHAVAHAHPSRVDRFAECRSDKSERLLR